MGRTGKLDFSIEKVRAVDGEYIPLRYTMSKREGGSHAVSTGVMTAGAAVLFWPAAPFFLLRKGKDVNINRGIVLEVFTDQDYTLKSGSVTQSTTQTPAPAVTGEVATVNIVSETAGAEVEVNGAFVGSVPAVGLSARDDGLWRLRGGRRSGHSADSNALMGFFELMNYYCLQGPLFLSYVIPDHREKWAWTLFGGGIGGIGSIDCLLWPAVLLFLAKSISGTR